ncbi:unnamed protein product, partial [Meganyctiphanes norvegica]|uniref:Replication factor-A protein 1 N-terminal domain-containing protein n=1 Tax=Meganyctiphanes norvegica TaxID=48144 RepID=A0AAV2QHV6_MEGNR
MADRLTKGAIAVIFEGRIPKGPVALQLLDIYHIRDVPDDRYRLYVSDGQWTSSEVWLKITLNGMVTSGEITQYCIIEISQCALNENKSCMLIHGLRVLESGAAVGKKLGDPNFYYFNNVDMSPEARKVAKSVHQPPIPLTRGVLPDIFNGCIDIPVCLVLQVLSVTCYACEKPMRFRLTVSDGQWSNGSNISVMLDIRLNEMAVSKDIYPKCIIKFKRFTCGLLPIDAKVESFIEIIDLVVLQSSDDVGHIIGDPQDFNLDKRVKDTNTNAADAKPQYQPLPSLAQHHWVKAFKKRGIYIKEAKHGTEKHIWHNETKYE